MLSCVLYFVISISKNGNLFSFSSIVIFFYQNANYLRYCENDEVLPYIYIYIYIYMCVNGEKDTAQDRNITKNR